MNHSKISELTDKINTKLKNGLGTGLSKIELDLVMQQLRELYDVLETLKQSESTQVLPELTKPDKTRLHSIQPEELIIQKKLLPNEHLLLGDFTEKQSQQSPVKQIEREYTPVEKVAAVRQAPAATNNPEKITSINESIQHPGSLNEKLKSSSAKEVHKRLASKPLKDLIDLNHRFILLNELFKGNSEAFSAAINHIDGLNDFESAHTFIKNQLVANYYWDESSQGARLFVKLVKQKFGEE